MGPSFPQVVLNTRRKQQYTAQRKKSVLTLHLHLSSGCCFVWLGHPCDSCVHIKCNPVLKVKAFGTTLKRTSFKLFVFFSVCNTWRIVRVFQILILGFWSLMLIRSLPVSLYTIVNFPLVSSDIGLSFGPYMYHTRMSCPVLSCLVTSRVA
jgi:hypothetical protein